MQRDPAPTPMWFVLEDGSTVSPPPGLTPQVVSRKVIVPAGVTAPAVGQFVSASGVVSTEPVTGGIDPVVLVRTQADIRTY